MIIRNAFVRQGHRIATIPARPWTRCLATEVDLESIESSLDNSLRETKSIESEVQKHTDNLVPQIDSKTHASLNLLKDGTAQEYNKLQRHSTAPLTLIWVYKSLNASIEKRTNALGSNIAPHYQPHTLLTRPPSPSDITLELLLASQAHLGHKTSHWHPMNSRYIFGIRQGIHIISLEVTAAHLRRACRVVSGVAERGGLILFVGTRPGQERCVVKAAEMAKGCHLFERWTPGSITNGVQLLGRCKLKIVDELDQDVPGFEDLLKDRPVLKPDLVVCLNPLENWVLLHECGLNAIPTIGIIDTDADPTWVTYPIPANDDSLRCVQVIAGALGRAGEEGQRNRSEKAMEGNITYTPTPLTSAFKGGKSRTGGSAADVHGSQS